MFFVDNNEYAMVTLYGEDADKSLSASLRSGFQGKDIKLLTPGNPETLEQSARNSVLVFIVISGANDPNIALAGTLRENRMIVSDIVAYLAGEVCPPSLQLLSKGFDALITKNDLADPSFFRFMQNKILIGNRRLQGIVQEEEYRRVCDTLSHAPASMIVFDHDKRVLFFSDHYFRAYPRIADRFIRGISVYDAFELMAKEEELSSEDPVYAKLRHFWYTLEGTLEFTLDGGTSYRLKAVNLPSQRGILVMAQNVSGYRSRNIELEEKLAVLQQELAKLKAR